MTSWTLSITRTILSLNLTSHHCLQGKSEIWHTEEIRETPQVQIEPPQVHMLFCPFTSLMGLADKGPKGGLAGSDIQLLSRSSNRKCTITGIDNHKINGLDIVQCGALVQRNHGLINDIMNEYVYYGQGTSIHSSAQIERQKNTVDDKSVRVGGKQHISTVDHLTSPHTRDPSVLDLHTSKPR